MSEYQQIMNQERILVIKLSAFGDFCLAIGGFEKIRKNHPAAHITLMTTAPFKDLAQQSPYFDEVRTIARWGTLAFGPWIRYLRNVWKNPYTLVYDLQSNDRTRILRRLSPPAMQKKWYDIRKAHAADAPADLAALAHITLPSDVTWLTRHATVSPPPSPYMLFVPGSAPQHPAKRWPAEHYAALAKQLSTRGITPVLLGTAAEAHATSVIAQACPQAVDLTARTSFADIAALAQHAVAAVGNDTGPMHLISLCGCPVVSLFSRASDPEKSAPRGHVVKVLRADDLADVSVSDVDAALKAVERA